MTFADLDINAQRFMTLLRLYGLAMVLLTLIREAECVKVNELASRTGMNNDLVEPLIKILAHAGLVEITPEGKVCSPVTTRSLAESLLYYLENHLTEDRFLELINMS